MHSRNRNGWAGILGNEDIADDVDRTDPNVEMPAFGDAAAEEKTVVASPPLHAGAKTKRLTLPRPLSDAGSPPPALEFPVQVDELVGKLEPSATDRSKDAPAARLKKAEGSLFTKEVVLTLIGGVLLLGGTLAYTRTDQSRAVVQQPAILPPPEPVPPKEAAPPTELKTIVAEAPPPTTQKTTTPILSILSNPSGARVEIDGTIYGATPLIQPSPPNVKSLSIRLIKDNYKIFEAVLTPNEAGHFNLNAALQRRR